MCRWIAYIGKPITMDTLVTKPAFSLVRQSFDSRMLYKQDGTLDKINGDGFGFGWYSEKKEPALFKTAEPAWNNNNIPELCENIKSSLFMAHIRAASIGNIQRSNSHPFKYNNWLFQHNGTLCNFADIKRDLQMAIAPNLFKLLSGSTDSETIFLLALTYGLETEPKTAIEKTIQRITKAYNDNSIEASFSLSCAFSDGKLLYTIRHSSSKIAHSQYYSTHTDCLKLQDEESDSMPKSSVVVVSEPLDISMQHWIEIPLGSFVTFHNGSLLRDAKIDIETLNI